MNAAPSTEPIAIVADDEAGSRLLLEEAARATGLTPLAFDNGRDALQAALTNPVGLVLLDVDMPAMDGYAVCAALRADARLVAAPIVMVTGHDDAAAITRAFDAGATDFIAKPVNWALLPHRLNYILRNAASLRVLAQRESQVRTLVEALPDRLWVLSPKGELQWSPQPGELAPPAHLPRVMAAVRETAADGAPRQLEYRLDEATDTEHTYEFRFSRREGGDVVAVRQDTSQRTAAARHIEQLAYFDPLTGLPNRQRCIETAERMLKDAIKADETVAFIYIDLNGFKRVNDTFGHAFGDTVLGIVGARLAPALQQTLQSERCDSAVARFGGDEFVILLQAPAARAMARRVGDSCIAVLREPITYDGLEFHATPSVGLAVFPDDGGDAATVLKHADTAMYQAKSAGGTALVEYAPAMSSRIRDWLQLDTRLRRALQQDLLHLHYQPKFRLSDRWIAGVEALARWSDAEHGDVPPARFIGIAEESGLIIEIGHWVIRAACLQARAWMDRGVKVPVAVNVSAKELLHGDPARILEVEAAAAGIPAALIEIEITESLLVRDSTAVRHSLDRFRSLGCRIALDDFGTGYSSLAYITRFPPDRIKIDRSFVHNVDQSPADAAVANAILSLGASLSLTITAEGIERSGQLEWLRQRGCHEGQGYLLARPMPARMFEARYLSQPADACSVSFGSLIHR